MFFIGYIEWELENGLTYLVLERSLRLNVIRCFFTTCLNIIPF